MWLLNAISKRLEFFNSQDEVPGGYAILSHTWGEEEVSFDEVSTLSPNARLKKGYKKITSACRHALKDNVKYCWVDTCKCEYHQLRTRI